MRWELIHGSRESLEARLNELEENATVEPCGTPAVTGATPGRFDRPEALTFALLVRYVPRGAEARMAG